MGRLRFASGTARASIAWREVGTGLALGAFVGAMVVDLDLPSMVSFWTDRTYLIPPAALLGAVLWRTRLRPLLAVLASLLSALWLAASFSSLSAVLAEGLVRRDPVRPGDAVFVFASRLQEDGEPGADATSRLLRGLELLGQRQAPRLVLSEMAPPARLYAPVARQWMAHLGLEGELLSVGPITNTHEEAVAVAALFRERGWKRVLAVTSPTHTRRASAVLEREGLVVVCVPSVETRYDLETLDWPSDRRKAFGSIVHERVGLWVYRWRGWIR